MKLVRRRAALSSILLFVFCAWSGCSKDTGRAAVSGKVTFGGEPLKSGIVKFIPADGRTATADSMIKDGEYTAAVPPGEKRVEITSPKVVGKRRMMPESPEIDIVEELLPAKYNTKTELTYSVTAGSQTKDFELPSK
jgi:hypothetical protein